MPPSREKVVEQSRYNRRVRQETIDAYGGTCACCGLDDEVFLTIDHVFNDGKKHRREMWIEGTTIHEFLKKNNYPKDRFQLLCYNCNMAKQFNTTQKGVCPHQQREPIELIDAPSYAC